MAKKIALAGLVLVIATLVVATMRGVKLADLGGGDREEVPARRPEVVETTAVETGSWQPTLSAVGSLAAVQGVMVSAEEVGIVRKIAFESGASVKRGALLVQLDTKAERARLLSMEAQTRLRTATLGRAKVLRQANVNTPAELDMADAEAKQAEAQLRDVRAAIARKTIRAPFAGMLGIRQVHLGQVVARGTPIVTLQASDRLHVNFALPQHQLSTLREGDRIRVSTDAFPGRHFEGTLTTINPAVDASTRNVRLQGLLENKDGALRPGMFVDVAVVLPKARPVLVIPRSAVMYQPYGNSVFVVERTSERGKGGAQKTVVRQRFVRVGGERADEVSVLSGLKQGEQVVTNGAFKLRPGMEVVVRAPPPRRPAEPSDS